MALPVAAFAQQADDEDTFEQRIIKNILGGMGVDVGRAGIEYRERSPLVIPPTRDLPPPQAAGSAAMRNPAWPREQQRKLDGLEPAERTRLGRMIPARTRCSIRTNCAAAPIRAPAASTEPGGGSIEEANVGRADEPEPARLVQHLQLERPDGHASERARPPSPASRRAMR